MGSIRDVERRIQEQYPNKFTKENLGPMAYGVEALCGNIMVGVSLSETIYAMKIGGLISKVTEDPQPAVQRTSKELPPVSYRQHKLEKTEIVSGRPMFSVDVMIVFSSPLSSISF